MEYSINVKPVYVPSDGCIFWEITCQIDGKETFLYHGLNPGMFLANRAEGLCKKFADNESDKWLAQWLAEHGA